mmetsp:Transcript_21396/g.45216  ORF Transcript_21396/g.45216 Transcript_21396/m.45216 type:complete len:112 (-) Transcript_21396:151-486(-)
MQMQLCVGAEAGGTAHVDLGWGSHASGRPDGFDDHFGERGAELAVLRRGAFPVVDHVEYVNKSSLGDTLVEFILVFPLYRIAVLGAPKRTKKRTKSVFFKCYLDYRDKDQH